MDLPSVLLHHARPRRLARSDDISTPTQTGYTPLIWACLEGHADISAMLLDRNADLYHANEMVR